MIPLSFSRLKLAVKLPMLVAAFAALVGASVMAALWPLMENTLKQAAVEQLDSVAASRKQAVLRRINDLHHEVIAGAQREEARDALKRLSKMYKDMTFQQRDIMVGAYAAMSRYPVGSREAVDDAGDGSYYSIIHEEVHPRLRRWAQFQNFHDILLVNEQGDVVYTVAKEDDFGTNLLSGPYAESGAGEAFRTAMAKVPVGEAVIVDFRPYPASGEAPSAFLASKITGDNSQVIGALVVQISVERFNQVTVDPSGLGETGEVYLVGTDSVLRSDSRFATNAALRMRIDNDNTRAALSGREGYQFSKDYRGADVLTIYRFIQLHGLTWGMVVKAETREVFAALRDAQIIAGLAGLAAILVVGGLGWLMTRHFTRPVVHLTDAMGGLAAGDLRIEVPYAERADELGDMARALKVFKSAVEQADRLAATVKESERQLSEVLNQTPLGVVVQNGERIVRFANDASLKLAGVSRFELVGSSMDKFLQATDPQRVNEFRMEIQRRGTAPERDIEFVSVRTGAKSTYAIAADSIVYGDEKCSIVFFYDVTERRQSERALEAEQRKTAALFEGAPDATVIVDQNGRVVLFNRQAENVFGYVRSEVLGKEIEVLLPERVRNHHPGLRASFSKTGVARQMGEGRELAALRKDGREFPVEISLSPIAGENLVAATVRDITERKKAETELRSFEFTIRHAAMGITLINKAGNFTYSNEHFCRLVGRSQEVLRQSAIEDVFVETINVGWAKRWGEFATSGAPATFERTLRLPDGKTVLCEITARHMKFGNAEFVCAFMHDISERKAAEAELRRVHYALEYAADGVIWARQDGTIVEINVATRGLLGRTQDEIIGHHMSEFVVDMSRENWDAIWAKYVSMGQNVPPPVERAIIRKDGGRAPVEVTARHISFGGIEYICAFLRDITDRKRAEQEILKSKEAAEEATRAKSAFLAMMSHEIRTPMNGVMSMAQMLDSTELNEDQRDISRVITSSAEALLTIISDILDFSKIEAGKFDLDSTPFDPLTAVEAAAELVAQRAFDKGIRLFVEIDPAIPAKLMGDANRLRQVVLNLVGNAIKFTERGHVHLRVRHLANKSSNATEWLRFEVADTGIGLTEEQLGKLFQAFQQADISTSRKFGGTGLGLMISKKITELMGGEIGANSTFGEGSTFWFEAPFPIVDHAIDRPPADISDLGIVSIGFDETGAGILNRYLNAAKVTRIEHAGHHDMEQVLRSMAPRAPLTVALLLARDSVLAVESLQRVRSLNIPTLKIVVVVPRAMISTIGHAKEAGADALLPLPLPRRLTWRTLGIAAGRISGADDKMLRSQADAEWEPPSVEEAREAGALLLVAEDNKTNQHVIRRILRRLGYAHEIANNGEEALGMYEKGRYGMILSDYHMPVMDGFALTTAIREREEGTGKRIPIIALTADAMAATEQHCLDAGMDGFLTKPIDIPALAAVLEKRLPAAIKLRRRPAESKDAQPSPAAKPPVATGANGGVPCFDVSRLADAFGSFNDDAKELVNGFVGELPDRIKELGANLSKGDAAAARDIVHALKGSSRSLGGMQLGEIASDLQSLLDDGKLDDARTLFPKLSDAAKALDRAVAEAAASTSA